MYSSNLLVGSLRWFRRASTYILLVFHWCFYSYCRIKENSALLSVIENCLKPGPWNKLKPFCAEQLDSLKFFIGKYPKVFPFPCWLIVVDFLMILWFMFVSLHRAMISKSLKMPIPVSLNQSLRSVLDCYHWSPKSKGILFREEEIEENSSSWCILILSKAFLIGKVTLPPRKRIDCSDFGRVFPVKESEEGEIPGCWTIDVHCSVQEEQETE